MVQAWLALTIGKVRDICGSCPSLVRLALPCGDMLVAILYTAPLRSDHLDGSRHHIGDAAAQRRHRQVRPQNQPVRMLKWEGQ